MEHSPTPEQAAIIDAVANPNGSSVLVEAGAGCAKTSTAKMAAQKIRVPGLAVAFNKRNAQDLEKELPSNFNSKTMNGLGHSAWMKARNMRLTVDEKKSGKLISEVCKARHVQFGGELWDYARLLFREAQIQGLVPDPFGRQFQTLVPDTHDGWQDLADSAGIPDDDFELVWEIAREALVENIKLAYQGLISYDDQIYCSTLLGGVFLKYPIVFVDEDQDLNPLQILMVKQSLGPNSRLLAVGDKCQSIYAFRGAVGEAAQQLKELRSNWIELPLMTSFRVPQLVADRQRDHVPLFRAFGANPTGQIINLAKDDGWTWSDITKIAPEWPSEVAILCRNNAPLLSMAFKLIRQGVGCHVLGRDMSKGLKALTKKICPDDNMKSDVVRGKINEWLNYESGKAHIADKPEVAEKYHDKAESLLAILESAECQDAGQLRRQIDKLFDRDSGVVTLSTVHKAKGMEWPTVIHLDPWRVPSTFAKKAGGRALEQEKNLKYVCETRTKHTLVMANKDSFQ